MRKLESESSKKSYERSKKINENRYFFVTKGGASVLLLNWYGMIKYGRVSLGLASGLGFNHVKLHPSFANKKFYPTH